MYGYESDEEAFPSDFDENDEIQEQSRPQRREFGSPHEADSKVEERAVFDRRSQEEIESARQVTSITDGIVGRSIERGFMDNAAALKCMAVLNYVTPDLMDPGVQEALIAKKPHLSLRSAFKNPMVQSFATGINRTALIMVKGLAAASMARVLLNACLSKMGLEAEGREKLLQLTQEIQFQMHDVCERTQRFALVMARTVERMGTTAFLLEEGADAKMLLDNLREASFAIEQDAVDVSQKTKLSQKTILDGCMYIQGLLQSDSQLELKKRGVDEAHEEWMRATETQKELEQDYYNREGALRFDIENSKGKIAMYERHLGAREADLSSVVSRLHHIHESIGRFEQMKNDVKSERVSELSQRQNIRSAAREAMQSEVVAQIKAYDVQIKRLQNRAQKLGMAADRYRAESLTASDGTELFVTRERQGPFFWSKKTYKEERRQSRPNDKVRLAEMADRAAEERRGVEQQLERLIREKNEIKPRVLSRMRQDHLKIDKNDAEYTQQRHGEQIREIDQQIKYFEELRGTVEMTRRKMEETIETLGNDIQTERRALQLAEDSLNHHQREDGHLRRRLTAAVDEVEEKRQTFERRRKAYEIMVKQFGIENDKDFATFMKVFQMLNTASQQLPQAMSMLSSSFQGAHATFNSEFFKRDFATLPPEKQRKTLQRVANDMQAICVVGWEYFQAPLNNLLDVNAKVVLAKLVDLEQQEQQQAAIERSHQPRIEEA